MPARRITWQRLVPGITALTALAGLAVSIIVFARVGGLHGRTYRLYVVTNEARGVLDGTQVWLAGQKVGLVSGVGFRTVSADSAARVVVRLDVLRTYREHIRRDSRVSIRSGGSLLGAPVIYIGQGSPTAPVLVDGDSLPETKQLDVEAFTSEIAIASRQLPEIIRNVRALSHDMQGLLQRLGSLEGDRASSMTVIGSRASRVTRRAGTGRGTLGLLLADHQLLGRAHDAIASADSIMQLLGSPQHSFGRFRRDTTLLRNLTESRDELSLVRARLAEARGTAGRAVRDSAITNQLTGLERGLGAIITDFRHHPMRYIAF